MQVTYCSQRYRPDLVQARYVRAVADRPGVYQWCEVGQDTRYDLRQGTIAAEGLPAEVRAAADALRGTWPGYARWSIT